jgi:hypothetical protein
MKKNSTGTPKTSLFDGTAWFDQIEASLRVSRIALFDGVTSALFDGLPGSASRRL